MPFGDFVKESLGLLELKMPDIEEIKELAWDEGYNQAIDDYQIWYYCAVCRARIGNNLQTDKTAQTRLFSFHLARVFISRTQDIVWLLTGLLKR